MQVGHNDPQWAPLARLTLTLRGQPGLVGYYEDGRLRHARRSSRGVRQGMVLSLLLSSLATRKNVHIGFTKDGVEVIAYLEDVIITGPADSPHPPSFFARLLGAGFTPTPAVHGESSG